MKSNLGRGFRGFALALAAACLAGCVVDDWPAITLTGGYQGFEIGVALGGRQKPRAPEPLAEAAALLSIQGEPAVSAKQPISGK